jgi:hypothetical protein
MRNFRLLAVLILAAAAAFADSYPTAWNYINPDSTVLLGFDWGRLQRSPFGEVMQEQLAGHSAGMPDLSFLENVNQILLTINIDKSSAKSKEPAAMLVMSGQFDLAALRKVASAKQMRPAQYRTVLLMVEAGKPWGDESVLALVSEQTLLFGDRKSIMLAIDRNAPNQPRVFSPTLARAAKLAETHDLWIMARNLANRLTGPMEGPLKVGQDVTGIEAGMSFQDGLDAEAALTAADDQAAAKMAQTLEALKPQLPKALQDFGVAANKNIVHLALAMDRQQLAAMIGEMNGQPADRLAAAPTPTPAAVPASVVTVNRQPITLAAAIPPPSAAPAPVEAPEPPKKPEKMVIKIFGLDDGPKEIPYSENQ